VIELERLTAIGPEEFIQTFVRGEDNEVGLEKRARGAASRPCPCLHGMAVRGGRPTATCVKPTTLRPMWSGPIASGERGREGGLAFWAPPTMGTRGWVMVHAAAAISWPRRS
jgi:hypothetical protein